MRNKYTSVSDPAGLTFKEVRSIISKQYVTVIKNDDKIIGIVRDLIVNSSLKRRLGIDNDLQYCNIGMLYIAKKERGQGFAGVVLKHFLSRHKNLIYIVHQSNVASNKTAAKHLKFFKKQSVFGEFEPFNIYKIEQ